VVPITLLVVSVARVDYTRLSTAGPAITLTLLLGTMLIATTEELMFRGVVLTFMRDRYREVPAAIVTTILFGLAHFPAGLLSVIAALLTGHLLYYARRVSGGLLVPIVVHGMFDFSIYSAATTADPGDDGSTGLILFLVSLVLLIAMIALHRLAAPRTTPSPSTAAPANAME
jgi:uncharacterized protein